MYPHISKTQKAKKKRGKKRGSISPSEGVSVAQVQFTKAGNFRARFRMASPTGLKQSDMWRFFPAAVGWPFWGAIVLGLDISW